MSRDSNSGTYRATRMWNDIVRTLRSGMPVGRHRKHMRTYMDCFVASQAVDWLHQHLRMNPNFSSDVTRQQTIALLQKFQKTGIIQDVRGFDHKHANVPFEDNSRLYRITDIPLHSPARRLSRCVGPSPSVPANGSIIPLRSPLKDVNKRASMRVSPAAWRHSIPYWIENDTEIKRSRSQSRNAALSIPYIDDPLSPPLEMKPGITSESALSVSSDVKSDGFEARDNSEMNIWLDIVLNRLRCLLRQNHLDDVISDTNDLNSAYVRHNFLNVSKNGLVTNIERNEHLPYWILSSMKYLAHGRTMDDLQTLPGPLSGLKYYTGLERDVFTAIRDFFLCLPEPLIPISFYEVFVNVLVHVDNFVHLENSYVGDIDSYGLDITSNRVVTDAPILNSRNSPGADADELSKSCAEMMHQMVRNEEQQEPVFKIPAIPPPRPSRRAVPQVTEYLETSFDGTSATAVTRKRRCCRRWSLGHQAGNGKHRQWNNSASGAAATRAPECEANWLSPFATLTWSPRYHSESDVRNEKELPENLLARQTAIGNPIKTELPSADAPHRSHRRSSSFHTALNTNPLRMSWNSDARECSSIASSTSSMLQLPLPMDRDDLLIACLQICCMMLPPGRRRRLHLLLRFMYKISNNNSLRLTKTFINEDSFDTSCVNRDVVICAFAETILRKQASLQSATDDSYSDTCKGRSNFSIVEARDVFALQLVGFMMDHHVEIMRIPENLKSVIVERLNAIQVARTQSDSITKISRPFCRQISKDEYESVRQTSSADALWNLLESIIDDPKLTTKERKKRLKQFKETHPIIYGRKFPTAESEITYLASLRKSGVFDRTLQKLKNIRL